MSSNHFDETEETLRRLNQRRKVLEQKTALRLATMDEFRVVKAESLARLTTTIALQNAAAKERNTKLLKEVNSISLAAVNHSLNKSPSTFAVDHVQCSQIKDQLAKAKQRYHQKIEFMLPLYKQKTTKAYEAELAEMKIKKKQVDDRRIKLQHDYQNEEMIKEYLEKERRGLALSVGI